jgi:hypothetical protein
MMTVSKLTLQNFRNHSHSDVDFGAMTGIFGETGSGKTSLLTALAYGLLGSCHLTDEAGRGAGAMIREGAENLALAIHVEGWGAVQRKRAVKGGELLCPGGVNATAQQAILAHFGVPRETLQALLDPLPLLSRTVADQGAMLAKILRPEAITPTAKLIDAGITHIEGIEHLDTLRKTWKEGTLRDFNRQIEETNVAIRAYLDAPPKWPFPQHTPETLPDLTQLLKKTRIARDKLSSDIGGMRVIIQADEAKFTINPVAISGLMSDEDLRKSETLVAEHKQVLADYHEDWKEAEASIVTITAERRNLMTRDGQIGTELNGLSEEKIEPHCPTCTCEMAAKQSTIQQRRQSLDLEHKQITKNDKSLQAVESEVIAKMDGLKVKSQGRRTQLADEQGKLDAHQAAIKAQELMARAESRESIERRLAETKERREKAQANLVSLDTEISQGEACIRLADEYNRKVAAGKECQRQHSELSIEKRKAEAVVAELEGLRRGIVDAGVGAFCKDMETFLKPFGLGPVKYVESIGFIVNGRLARYLSGGQSAVLFEAAFRVATAYKTKVRLVLLDHCAPVDDACKGALIGALLKSGLQTVMTWNRSDRPKQPAPPGVRRYWCEARGGVARVEEILVKE